MYLGDKKCFGLLHSYLPVRKLSNVDPVNTWAALLLKPNSATAGRTEVSERSHGGSALQLQYSHVCVIWMCANDGQRLSLNRPSTLQGFVHSRQQIMKRWEIRVNWVYMRPKEGFSWWWLAGNIDRAVQRRSYSLLTEMSSIIHCLRSSALFTSFLDYAAQDYWKNRDHPHPPPV